MDFSKEIDYWALRITIICYGFAYFISFVQFWTRVSGKAYFGISLAVIVHQFVNPTSEILAANTVNKLFELDANDFSGTVSLLANFYYVFALLALMAVIPIFSMWLFLFTSWVGRKKNAEFVLKNVFHPLGGTLFAVAVILFLNAWTGIEYRLERQVKLLSVWADFNQLNGMPVQLKGTKQVLHKNGFYTHYQTRGDITFGNIFTNEWDIEFITDKVPSDVSIMRLN